MICSFQFSVFGGSIGGRRELWRAKVAGAKALSLPTKWGVGDGIPSLHCREFIVFGSQREANLIRR